ncbi:unnamed protein product [Caenorhabditis nigoni]
MASDLKLLTEKAEELSIDPIYDTNWCDMPAEIKLECIGKMEFNERLSLRCTAKAERSLVDSQKIEFHEGVFWGYHEDLVLRLYPDNKNSFPICSERKNRSFEFMKYITEIGEFEKLEISIGGSIAKNEQFFADIGLFTVKKIEFSHCDINSMIAILRKVKNGVESIEIGVGTKIVQKRDELSKILEIPQIQDVPYWHIYRYIGTDCLHKVAQMWIDRNSNIGSTFQTMTIYEDDGAFKKFLDQFDDRIVSISEKRARIRTNNPDRHILLERGLDDVITSDYYIQFFRSMVISADMKESEYDDNCMEWICRIAPEMHDMYNVNNIHDDDEDDDYDAYGHHGYDDYDWEPYDY